MIIELNRVFGIASWNATLQKSMNDIYQTARRFDVTPAELNLGP